MKARVPGQAWAEALVRARVQGLARAQDQAVAQVRAMATGLLQQLGSLPHPYRAYRIRIFCSHLVLRLSIVSSS